MPKSLKEYAPLVWLTLGGAALGFLAAIAFVGFPLAKEPVPRIRGPKKAEEPPPLPPPPGVADTRDPLPVEPLFPPPRPLPVQNPAEPLPGPKIEPLQIARGEFSRRVARSNMACLVLEILRYRSHAEGVRRMQNKAEEFQRALAPIDEKKQEELFRTRARLYCKSGDRIVWFEGIPLDPANPQPLVRAIEGWLHEFQPGATILCWVVRDGDPLQVQMYFPERTQELVEITAVADIFLGRRGTLSGLASGGEMTPKSPGDDEIVIPFPSALLSAVKDAADPLPPFYHEAIPEGIRVRARKLLAAGRGTLVDIAFLRDRYLDAYCKRFSEEVAMIRARRAALERSTLEFAMVDILDLKDGRRLGGILQEAGEDWVVLKVRRGNLRIPRHAVYRITKGAVTLEERRRRYAEARGNPNALRALVTWCRERQLKDLEKLAWYALLEENPGHAQARVRAGLAAAPAEGF